MIIFEKLSNGNVKVTEAGVLKFVLQPNNCNITKNNYGYIEIDYGVDTFVFPHSNIIGASCIPAINVSTVDTALLGLGIDFFFKLTNVGNTIFVEKLSDLPAPVAGVITLTEPIFLINHVDLLGNRLYIPILYGDINGLGTNSVSLTSTGLGASVPLLTFEGNSNLCNFTVKNVGTAFYINNSLSAFDWSRVNFENCANVGEIVNCLFFVMETMAFLNSPNLKFSGTLISFVASPNNIWRGALGANDKLIIFTSSFVATARVRIQDSRFSLISSQIAIDFQVGATVPNSGFELQKVGITGGLIAVQGINGSSLTAIFTNSSGIGLVNSFPNAIAYIRNNATNTTFLAANTLYSILGTFLQGAETQKFSVASNGIITCNNPNSELYGISINANVSSGNNQEAYLQVFVNGVLNNNFIGSCTTTAAGKADNMVLFANITLAAGDTFEVKIAKASDTTALLVKDIVIKIV